MQFGKLSLINQLMEEGEEDTAVRIAGSDLPEELDLERDGGTLLALGMEEDELRALLPAIEGSLAQRVHLTPEEVAALERTISERWAQLVAYWNANRGT